MSSLDALLARSPNARRRLPAPDRARVVLQRCFGASLPYPVVKVAGTNGKGSVCAMLGACLSAQGFVTGRFTSPHLVDVTERFSVDDEQLSRAELDVAAAAVAAKLDGALVELGDDFVPSYFETLLLVALEAFAARGVRVAILEAGIGGAHDAVSAVPGVLGVISSVGLDHVEQLGPTEAEIARDKAAIACPSTTLVVGSTVSVEARRAIEAVARERSVRTAWVRSGRVKIVEMDLGGSTVDVTYGDSATRVRLALAGAYQLTNLETTVAALDALPQELRVDAQALRGLETARWPGRFETVRPAVRSSQWPGRSETAPAPAAGSLRWLLDVAHNPQGIAALAAALARLLPYDERVLLCGVSAEHESAELFAALGRLAPRIHVADGYYRAAPAWRIAAALGPPAEIAGDVETAVAAMSRYSAGVTVVVTGSLYLVGAVRPLLVTP